jgi:hypothetical protein
MFWQRAPRASGSHHPHNPFDDQTMIDRWAAYRGLLMWEQRADALPLRIGEPGQSW